jgi:hypothetical protein
MDNLIKIEALNFEQYKSKITALIATKNDSGLKNGFDFVCSNIGEYHKDSFVKDMVDIFFAKLNNIISKEFPSLWQKENKGYSGNMFTGSKYEQTKTMDIVQLSKLVKEELNIYFPDWKFSVKTDRFSGGQSLTVNIKELPYNPYSKEKQKSLEELTDFYPIQTDQIYSEQYLNDSKRIRAIVEQYNFDDSDAMVDYFHVRYYSHVRLEELDIYRKFYPNHPDLLRHDKFNAEWEEKRKKKKEKADNNKGKFKKGQEVVYVYNKEYGSIPKGEYKAVILKSPNGRAMLSYYEIRFYVNKKIVNGQVIELEKPIIYKTNVYVNSHDLKEA